MELISLQLKQTLDGKRERDGIEERELYYGYMHIFSLFVVIKAARHCDHSTKAGPDIIFNEYAHRVHLRKSNQILCDKVASILFLSAASFGFSPCLPLRLLSAFMWNSRILDSEQYSELSTKLVRIDYALVVQWRRARAWSGYVVKWLRLRLYFPIALKRCTMKNNEAKLRGEGEENMVESNAKRKIKLLKNLHRNLQLQMPSDFFSFEFSMLCWLEPGEFKLGKGQCLMLIQKWTVD